MSEILLPHLEDASFLYSAGGNNDRDFQRVDRDHETSQWVIAELGRKSLALAEVAHNETGLNQKGINDYFGRYGLAGKSFVGVDEKGQQDINNKMGYGYGPTQTVANHFPLLDFTYVLRGAYETARGSAAIEAEVVHELFHAYKPPQWEILMWRLSASDRIVYSLRRNGFVSHSDDVTHGSYLEEGGAEIMQLKYVTEELGLPNGFLNRTKPQKVVEEMGKYLFTEYLLPGNYLYATTEDGSPKWHKSAHAAFGMQLLIAQDPAILSAMLTSRKDADSQQEFAGRINSLSSGLFSALNDYPYDHASFAEGTGLIIDTLYDGDRDRALQVALGRGYEEIVAA